MQATDILSSEHRVIERVIAALSSGADRLEAGQDMLADFFLEGAQFIKGFADGCHHRKEENVLFEMMANNGMSKSNGPIAVMLYEHEQGRLLTKGMRLAAERLQSGDLSAKAEVISYARAYAELLTQHIYKEDMILFPLADRVIPVEKHAEVMQQFEYVEHEETGEGVHEKYLALAQAMEQEIA